MSLSYDLLDNELKQRFRALGVFPAPFWVDSAAAIWEINDSEEAQDVLGALLNRSLLTSSPSPFKKGDEEGPLFFYALHDLTRLFATDRLIEGEEYEPALMTHATHYLELAGVADTQYLQGGDSVVSGLNLFRVIWSHLLIAWERLSRRGENLNQDQSHWFSDFPSRCAYVLDLHLPPRQKIPLLEEALKAAMTLEDRKAEGVHLGNLGLAYAALGDARKAIEFYEQQLVIVREIGDRRGEGNALANMGMAYKKLNQPDRARERWSQALTIFQVIESPHAKTVRAWLAQLDGIPTEEQKQGLTVEQFIEICVSAAREKKPEAAQLFEAAGKLAGDPGAPKEIRALGKILQKIVLGELNPDLSELSDELAGTVREALKE